MVSLGKTSGGKTSGMRVSLFAGGFGLDGGAHFIGSGGKLEDADADRVVERVHDGGSRGNQCLFADAFCPVGANRRRIFDQDGFNGWHVANGGDEIVVQIFSAAGEKFFHECHAEALGHAAFDLPFDESGIDGAADVVSGGEADNFYGAEFGVHFDFGEMRAEAVDGVGGALSIFVEGFGGWVEGGFGAEDVAVVIEGQIAQTNL